jgi:hypothetical protein
VIVSIEPETKSWTWVLERRCEECGFDTRSFSSEELGLLLRLSAEPWPALLAHPSARVRPREDCWSAVEYACHVRDAYRTGLYRLERMVAEDNPQFVNWDQDETAVSDRYDLQDPTTVAAEVLAAGTAFADAYDRVSGDEWNRRGLRSDGASFTVDSFGRYFLHDPMHHIVDVRRGFDAIAANA